MFSSACDAKRRKIDQAEIDLKQALIQGLSANKAVEKRYNNELRRYECFVSDRSSTEINFLDYQNRVFESDLVLQVFTQGLTKNTALQKITVNLVKLKADEFDAFIKAMLVHPQSCSIHHNLDGTSWNENRELSAERKARLVELLSQNEKIYQVEDVDLGEVASKDLIFNQLIYALQKSRGKAEVQYVPDGAKRRILVDAIKAVTTPLTLVMPLSFYTEIHQVVPDVVTLQLSLSKTEVDFAQYFSILSEKKQYIATIKTGFGQVFMEMRKPLDVEKERYQKPIDLIIKDDFEQYTALISELKKYELPILSCNFRVAMYCLERMSKAVSAVSGIRINSLLFTYFGDSLESYMQIAALIDGVVGLNALIFSDEGQHYSNYLQRVSDTEGVKQIMSALSRQKCLRTLVLKGLGITEDGMFEVSQFAKSAATLTVLSLCHNHFTDMTVKALAEALNYSKTIETFTYITGDNFGNNTFSVGQINTFCKTASGPALCEFKYRAKKLKEKRFRKNEYETVSLYFKKDVNLDTFHKKTTEVNREQKSNAFIAIRTFNRGKLEAALQRGVSLYGFDDNGNTLLHAAIKSAHDTGEKAFECITLLLNSGVDLNVCNAEGLTPTEYADQFTLSQSMRTCLKNPEKAAKAKQSPQKTLQDFFSKQAKSKQDAEAGPAATAAPMVLAQAPAPQPQPVVDETVKRAWLAIAASDNAIFSDCIVDGLDFSVVNPYGQTLLILAAGCADEGLFSVILGQSKAQLAHQDNGRKSVLHYLCELPLSVVYAARLVRVLGDMPDAVADEQDMFGYTPLFYLAKNASATTSPLALAIAADMALALLKKGADPQAPIQDLMPARSTTPLLKAAEIGSEYMVMMLFSFLRDNEQDMPAVLADTDGLGNTVFHYAAKNNLSALVEMLCYMKAVSTKENKAGETPLTLAPAELLADMQCWRALKTFGVPGMYWSADLALEYGCKKGKQKRVKMPGKNLHTAMRNDLSSYVDKNERSTRNVVMSKLTFVISTEPHVRGGTHGRTLIEVDLHEDLDSDVHQKKFWRDRASGGTCDEERVKVTERFKAAPESLKQRAVSDFSQWKKSSAVPLSEAGIADCFDKGKFPLHFHHAEMGLFAFLEDEKTLDYIVSKILEKYTAPGFKIYAIVLDAHSKYYVCANCEMSVLGLQNPMRSTFIRGLSERLEKRGFKFPRLGLQMTSRISAGFKWARQEKAKEDHQEWYIDLRHRPFRMVTLHDSEVMAKNLNGAFSSRA